MTPQRLDGDRLSVPVPYPLPDGGVVDKMETIGPGDPAYASWKAWMERMGLWDRPKVPEPGPAE